MKIKPIAAALVTLGAVSTANVALAGETEDRIADLERQLAELKALVTNQQQNITANTESITVAKADIEEARPMAKGTKFTYGGFVQADVIATDYSEGKPGNALIEDFLVPSLIPVEPADGKADSYQSTNMHVKTSRFYFTTATNTDAGKISSRIELDFVLSGSGDERISNSWNSRIRHAFVKWDYDKDKSLLAGQTWSTFFNVGALPDHLDFVGPVGTLFNRQPMIRWTSGGLQLAIENPATRLNGTAWDNYSEGLPDFVARYNSKWGDLSWSVAGIARELAYETRSSSAVEEDSDEQYGYGLSLAGKWMLGKDDIRFMVNYGDALGRYLGLNAFNDGYVDTDGDIQTEDQLGAFLAYRHFWSPQWNSTFGYSLAQADNPSETDFIGASSLAESYQSVHASLNWMPTPKLRLGGEYIWAEKELEDGRSGDMSRLQFAVKYGF